MSPPAQAPGSFAPQRYGAGLGGPAAPRTIARWRERGAEQPARPLRRADRRRRRPRHRRRRRRRGAVHPSPGRPPRRLGAGAVRPRVRQGRTCSGPSPRSSATRSPSGSRAVTEPDSRRPAPRLARGLHRLRRGSSRSCIAVAGRRHLPGCAGRRRRSPSSRAAAVAADAADPAAPGGGGVGRRPTASRTRPFGSTGRGRRGRAPRRRARSLLRGGRRRSRISVSRRASSDGAGVSSIGSPRRRRSARTCIGFTTMKKITAATETKVIDGVDHGAVEERAAVDREGHVREVRARRSCPIERRDRSRRRRRRRSP